MKELREILRELREDMDLTQSDIADYLGGREIIQFLQGQHRLPSRHGLPLSRQFGSEKCLPE